MIISTCALLRRREQRAAGYWVRLACLLACFPLGVRAEDVDFERDVWSVFARRCVECHGVEKQSSSFRVDSRAALLKGGELGDAVIAGDPGKSYLLKLIGEGDGDLRMPPDYL